MPKAASMPPVGLAAKWKRWKFHLSSVLLIVPMAYLPAYFDDMALARGDKGLGERIIGEKMVGPWKVNLAESRLWEPLRDGEAGYVKSFALSLCTECIPEVKAAYLRIDKPRSLRAAGAILFGSPYRMSASVVIPERTKHDSQLWLTLEGWDGSMHQAGWPLEEVSPITVEWLKKQGR